MDWTNASPPMTAAISPTMAAVLAAIRSGVTVYTAAAGSPKTCAVVEAASPDATIRLMARLTLSIALRKANVNTSRLLSLT
jgi:hypothetical protein